MTRENNCQTTATPPLDAAEIAVLKERYRRERDKRLRPEGQRQYASVKAEFSDAYLHDPHRPVEPRDPVCEDLDVAILGAGWSGLLSAYHLRNAGVHSFRNIDHAGDWGGCWYWNRYPGIQCDNDAYCYLPLLEETGFMPSKKYADGYEIHDYFKLIASRFDLGKRALFHTLVTGLRWDDNIRRWRVSTNRGDEIHARFVIMANGLLNIPKLPTLPGIGDFQGKMFHTSRWDYRYTGGDYRQPVLDRLGDKKVAIVGTGATAIQAIPYLGRYCQQLYVLQRTPPPVDQRDNAPTDPAWVKSLAPGWQKARQENFQRAAIERFQRGEPDLICDFWTEINRNLSSELEAEGWPDLTPADYMARREVMDFRVMERMRRRIESLVEDKATAEALKPWYQFLCKRPLSNDDYYDTFNRANVRLIDVSESLGVERLTAKGFVTAGVEYEVDCMIFASGFEVTSDLDRRWGIEVIAGRDGVSLYDHWGKGYKTLHGIMTDGFPNLFFIGYYQGGLNATTTEQYSRQAFHIAHIIGEAQHRGLASVEAESAAQDSYIRMIRASAVDLSEFQDNCTPSYFNNEGEREVDENGVSKYRWYLGESYGPGWEAFEQFLADWRNKGDLDGLAVERLDERRATPVM